MSHRRHATENYAKQHLFDYEYFLDGERLVKAGGFDIKYAPIHAAFVAYVRGERFLRDVNPEVRRPAQGFYDKLSAPRRHAGGEPAGKPKRGRKRKA